MSAHIIDYSTRVMRKVSFIALVYVSRFIKLKIFDRLKSENCIPCSICLSNVALCMFQYNSTDFIITCKCIGIFHLSIYPIEYQIPNTVIPIIQLAVAEQSIQYYDKIFKTCYVYLHDF